ncbi:MAG TPA: MaoC family dehydratase [Xanthobacteraceae bacterium]|nr:MaoC family dehydratase [Xanthobacteraceae bacterium]
MLAFEDFQPGHFGTFGPRLITREEIIAYAQEYDPQPMHLDDEAAKRSLLGGLAGSGWHLCSLLMRMMYDGYIHRTASLGSPGIDEVRWTAPFRPGDELTLDVEVLSTRVSQSRPDIGIVTSAYTLKNAKGETVLYSTSPLMIKRRAALEAER